MSRPPAMGPPPAAMPATPPQTPNALARARRSGWRPGAGTGEAQHGHGGTEPLDQAGRHQHDDPRGEPAAEAHGRHRYYRLSGPHVGELLEALARLADAPVRSLREGSRAHAVRSARTCYDHLARPGGHGHHGRPGRAGSPGRRRRHLRSPPQRTGPAVGARPGLRLPAHRHRPGMDRRLRGQGRHGERRPLIRYCVDWSEQLHHLAGGARRRAAHPADRAGLGPARAGQPGRAHHRRRPHRPGHRLGHRDARGGGATYGQTLGSGPRVCP